MITIQENDDDDCEVINSPHFDHEHEEEREGKEEAKGGSKLA